MIPVKPHDIIVFVGPTLDVDTARGTLNATYLPPACCGDIYRAAQHHPRAIGLIDGYFEGSLSVWHKEILWAQSQGTYVFGSASMGALRAAELTAFGMVGVGAIYEGFCEGRWEDDDEVTIAHGPSQEGYPAQSEAMVNIRFTLAAAQQQGFLDPEEQAILVELAKQTFYPQRSYEKLLQDARRLGGLSAVAERLDGFLSQGRIDQKRLDALAMLQQMKNALAPSTGPLEVRYTFQKTVFWLDFCQRLEPAPSDLGAEPEADPMEGILDELRLQGAAYHDARQGAGHRALALRLFEELDLPETTPDLPDATQAFRKRRGLLDDRTFHSWLAAQGWSFSAWSRWLLEQARLERLEAWSQSQPSIYLQDYLRTQETYGSLRRRTGLKEYTLRRHGLDHPTLEDAGLDEEGLWQWYFDGQLGAERPADLDRYAQSLDLPDSRALRRLVLRELCFQRAPASATDRPSTHPDDDL